MYGTNTDSEQLTNNKAVFLYESCMYILNQYIAYLKTVR